MPGDPRRECQEGARHHVPSFANEIGGDVHLGSAGEGSVCCMRFVFNRGCMMSIGCMMSFTGVGEGGG